MAGFGTLREVQRDWTLKDLMDASDVLDVREDLERQAADNARAKQP